MAEQEKIDAEIQLAWNLNELLHHRYFELYNRCNYANRIPQAEARPGEEIALLLTTYITKKEGTKGLKKLYNLLGELGETRSIDLINKSAVAESFWGIKILPANGADLPSGDKLSSAPFIEESNLRCNTETWITVNKTNIYLRITNVRGEPVTFEMMDLPLNERTARGPFYYPNDTKPTHTFYKLRFGSTGPFRLIWHNTDIGIKTTTLITVAPMPSKDDSLVDEYIKPKSTVPNQTRALLPANYTIQFKETKKKQANIMFLLPEDQLHYDCVFNALSQLEYKSQRREEYYFLAKSQYNILLCNVAYLLNDPTARDYFNELLLFVPQNDSEELKSVNKVVIPNEPDLNLKPRVGTGHTVQFTDLNPDEQTIVRLLQNCEVHGFITLSTTQQDSITLYKDYIPRWMLSAERIEQHDIYIQIKVDDTNSNTSIDHVANQLFGIAQQNLQPMSIDPELWYYGTATIVISGPPITWWLINRRWAKIAEDIAQLGLKLLDISQINTWNLIGAVRKDPRNQKYAFQMFALVCRMHGTQLVDNARVNKTVIAEHVPKTLPSNWKLPAIFFDFYPTQIIKAPEREFTTNLIYDLNSRLRHRYTELYTRSDLADIVSRVKAENPGHEVAELITHIYKKYGMFGLHKFYGLLKELGEISSCELILNSSAAVLFLENSVKEDQELKTDPTPLGVDPHSYSNNKQVHVKHIHIDIRVNFNRKIFYGHVNLDAELLEDASEMLLDAKSLAVEKVIDRDSGNSLLWTIPKHHEHLGFCLQVPLPVDKRAKGSTVNIQIRYSTTPESGGIQWLEPQQTDGKKHPYIYTQCEAILARTLLPCQDTPIVKSPYSIKVSVPSPLVVVCSGTSVHAGPIFEEDGWLTWEYKQSVPIPTYLIAVVAGALENAKTGPRSTVWTEKALLSASIHEFSDTEKFIQAGEQAIGIPYTAHNFKIAVLPGAFPYGGMENPHLACLSRSLLTGDQSLPNIVAHEIAHSWAGNLVTNATWKDFWLNEGFAVYIERLILGILHNSEPYRYFEAMIGYNHLVKTVADFSADSEWTKLQPNMNGIDPDEVFYSKIPSEKGSLFLLYLETLVGGKQVMQKWLNKYFETFKYLSVTTEQMKEHFLNYFSSKHKVSPDVLKKIDWDHWLNAPGLPSFDPRDTFDMSLAKNCLGLAKKWSEEGGNGTTINDLKKFQIKQTMYFLDILLATAIPMQYDTLHKLDNMYSLSNSNNVEILFRWIMLCLKSNDKSILPAVSSFLSNHGRGLYVLHMYHALNEVDHKQAVCVYKANRLFYHSVIRNFFDPILSK